MTPDEEQEREDDYFIRGHRAATVDMLRHCLDDLGYGDPEAGKKAWIAEREAAVTQLRLADIIDKHLGKYLHAVEEG